MTDEEAQPVCVIDHGSVRVACDACDRLHAPDDLWRVTRRPNDEIVTVDARAFCDRDPVVIQVSGPQHLMICPTCWGHVTGWVGEMNRIRRGEHA